MKYFVPISPDPRLKKRKGDGALARFGHLNVIVDKLNEFDAHQAITALAGGGQVGATQLDLGFNLVTTATTGDSVVLPSLEAYCACTGGCGPVGPVIVKNDGPGSLTIYPFPGEDIDGGAVNIPITLDPGSSVSFTDMDCNSWESYSNSTDPAFTGVNSVSGCLVDNTNPANPIINDILIEPVSATEALTGDGCITPLSVCIDGTTITKDLNGCLQALGGAVAPAFAMFYGLTTGTGNGGPNDYAATVAVKTAAGTGRFPFPRTGPTVGGITNGSTVFTIPTAGTYEISFVTSVDEAGQLQLEVNGADLPETLAGRATGTNQIVGNSIITVPAGALLAVVNASGNAAALTVTPSSGSLTHAQSQTLTIKRLA